MCVCQNCGLNYRVDIIVPDDIWRDITPKPETEEGGLLCPKCIGEKIEDISGHGSYKLVKN